MLKVKSRIFKTILQLNALNPCKNFRFEWDGTKLEISSISNASLSLECRTYSIIFEPSKTKIVEEFLNSMCYKIPECYGYFMDINSIPTKNCCDRIFRAIYELSTYTPIFDYMIEHENNLLTITNRPMDTYGNISKTVRVRYTYSESKDVEEFMNMMFKREHLTSKHWHMKIDYLFTCV